MKIVKKIIVLLILLCFVSSCGVVPKEKEKEKPKKKEEVPEEVNELFGEYQKQAAKKVKNMTLEEKVGQIFLARMDSQTVFEEIKTYYPGGYVLFARDFEDETKESMKDKISSYQKESKTPLIMAVDEEGGIVTRVSRYPNFRASRFPSSQEIYAEGGFESIEAIEKEKIDLLKSLGLNLNLAPVADLSTNEDDYIYSRSFGKDANLTSEFITRVVKVNVENNFANSLKHFPGYGNNVDTHTGIAIDERSYETFTTADYLPFQAGIEQKSPTILVSHNIVKAIDSDFPASLSKKVHDELRKNLNFSGLIITDDLAMDAILDYTNDESSTVLAVNAGNDLIITSSLAEDYQAVLMAVKEGKISLETLNKAVERILAFKYQYHIS